MSRRHREGPTDRNLARKNRLISDQPQQNSETFLPKHEQENVHNLNKAERKMVEKQNRAVPCVKYFIFGFNLIMMVIGFALAALGVWLKADPRFREFLSQRYRQVVSDATWDAPTLYFFAYVLIGLGCLMILVALVGCCGAILENSVFLVLYFVLLFILFFVTLGCGIFLFVKRDAIENEVGDALTYMVQHYYQGPGVIQEAMDALQQAFRCCGNSGCGDYRQLRSDVPRSCDISCDGCRHRMYRALRDGFTITTVIFIIVLLAELLGIVLSMYLFCWLMQNRRKPLYYYGPQSIVLREDPPQAGYPTLSTKTKSPAPIGDLSVDQRQLQQQQYHQQNQQQQRHAQHSAQHYSMKEPAYANRGSPQREVAMKTTVFQGADNRGYQYPPRQAPPRPPPPYYEGGGGSPQYQEKQWRFA